MAHHLKIRAARRPRCAQRVAVERIFALDHLDTSFFADRICRLWRKRALRKDRLHPLGLYLGHEVLDVGRRQLGRSVEARNDRTDKLEAVAVNVVAEGIVIRHELLVRQAVDLGGDLSVEGIDLGAVVGQVLGESLGMRWIRCGQRCSNVAHHDFGVARVLPDMRITFRFRGVTSTELHTGRCVNDGAFRFRALDRGIEPLFQSNAVLDDHCGVGQVVEVGWRRFEVVRIDVRPQQPNHPDISPTDLGDEIGELGRGGDNEDRLARRCDSAVAGHQGGRVG